MASWVTAVFFGLLGLAGLAVITFLVLREGFGIGPDVRQVVPDHIPIPPPLLRPAITLDDGQRAVREHMLKNANKPESVWFEEWHPAVQIPEETFYVEHYTKLETANEVVHVIYRATYPITGEIRHDSLFYLMNSKIVGENRRAANDDFDQTLTKYYGKP